MKKKIGYFIVLVVIIVASYVVYSTKSVDKMKYRSIAWGQLSKGAYFRERFEYSWQAVDVKMINLNKEDIIPKSGIWNKSNFYKFK